MSSSAYSTELEPDPTLRRIVVAFGIGATVVGIGVLSILPLAISWRLPAAVIWIALNARQLHIIVTGHRRCQRIRLQAGGKAEIKAPDGCWADATILSGSIVIRDHAWLRFELPNGTRCAELIRRKKAENQSWRRLQVIWRHLGAGG